MKITTTSKLIILSGGIVLFVAAQWRWISRLQGENQELRGARELAEQTRIEFDQVTQTVLLHESEAQSLRAEVVKLRNEIELFRRETEHQKNTATYKNSAAAGASERWGKDGKGGSPVSLAERRVFHMHPSVRSNLNKLPVGLYQAAWSSSVDGVTLWNGIARETIEAGPSWRPSQPVPLSDTEAEEIARREFRTIVQDEPSWELYTVELRLLPNSNGEKWHYAIGFRSIDTPPDRFTILVALSGALGTTGVKKGTD